ncbi:hypothetical protein K1I42_04760 [Hydrogenophilus thermoluteolus]|uniref:heme biosynthesis protein HemY n=1 Tax=Hydrogenophilus thermoluteolus TaxID=297 RepID=UPI001C6418D8|nr:heme biosynthesis HemY N-terminal domain-containing protein [Hydrogenophilus thermoluteolus]MBW7656599.1 hypothetical protein [Hydrogenophilus thermoluteolus]HNQ48685.1 heme biosynthesis HemY N-terminal domain-containing protein [Hydrogenophilus thermoluteolus]HNU18968.1 heme biosynthesis HemY N-terminal domain-containing protein [Hydrogenophilus thermoluteolus]
MRTVLAVLIAAVAAVAFALWFQTLDGYVVAVFPPYRFQLSSQLLVLLALLFLFVGYGVLRLVARIIGTPASVRHWRERRRLQRALDALEMAVVGWELGKPKMSFKALDRAYRLKHGAAAAAAAACEAALAVRDEARAENALARIPDVGDWMAVRQVLEARFGLVFRRIDRLEAALTALERGGKVAPTVRERLRLEAGTQLERWEMALEAARKLRRHDALPAPEFLAVAVKAYPALLTDALRRERTFDAWWESQPKDERQLPAIVAAVIRTLRSEGEVAQALRLAETFLRRRYATEVVAELLPLLPAEPAWLDRLERWLGDNENDPVLHEALLRLTLGLQLWGKAKGHYAQLLQLDPVRARVVAAETLLPTERLALPWDRASNATFPVSHSTENAAGADAPASEAERTASQPPAAEAAADTESEPNPTARKP